MILPLLLTAGGLVFCLILRLRLKIEPERRQEAIRALNMFAFFFALLLALLLFAEHFSSQLQWEMQSAYGIPTSLPACSGITNSRNQIVYEIGEFDPPIYHILDKGVDKSEQHWWTTVEIPGCGSFRFLRGR